MKKIKLHNILYQVIYRLKFQLKRMEGIQQNQSIYLVYVNYKLLNILVKKMIVK